MENKEEVRTFLFFEGIYDQVKRIEERLGAEKALNFLKSQLKQVKRVDAPPQTSIYMKRRK